MVVVVVRPMVVGNDRDDARTNAPRRNRDDARNAVQRRDVDGNANANAAASEAAPVNPALEKSRSRYKGGIKSQPANGRGIGGDHNNTANADGRKRPVKRVDSNGNRRDRAQGDNSISSGLSFMGSTEERRANGNGGNVARNARPQGKRTGANRNRTQRGPQSGGQPGGSGRANSSGKQSRRERA